VLEYFLSTRHEKGVSQCAIAIAYDVLVNTQVKPVAFISKIHQSGVHRLVRLARRSTTRSQFPVSLAAVALAIAFKRYLRTDNVPDCALFSDDTMDLDEACLFDVIEDSRRNLPPFERTHRLLSDEDLVDRRTDEENESAESPIVPHVDSSSSEASAEMSEAKSDAVLMVEPAPAQSLGVPEEEQQEDDTPPDVPHEGANTAARVAAEEIEDEEDSDEDHKRDDDDGGDDGPSSSMQVFLPRGDGPEPARPALQEEFRHGSVKTEEAEDHPAMESVVPASTNSERRGRVRVSQGPVADVTVIGQVARMVRMLCWWNSVSH
jgi:hypothetical protein